MAAELARWLLLAAVMGGVGCHPAPGGYAESGNIVVSHAAVSVPPAGAPAPAFLLIENRATDADTLVEVRSPEADSVVLHAMVGGRMQPLSALAVPPREQVRLRPGSYHLMLEGVRRTLAVGDTVVLILRFVVAGEVPVRTPVLRYSEAVRE
jgi:copper(I)-binding protein